MANARTPRAPRTPEAVYDELDDVTEDDPFEGDDTDTDDVPADDEGLDIPTIVSEEFSQADIEVALDNPGKLKIHFTAKVPVSGVQFAMNEAGMELELDLPPGALIDEAATINGVAALLKAATYTTLDVPFSVDPKTRMVSAVMDGFKGPAKAPTKGPAKGRTAKAPAKRSAAPARGRAKPARGGRPAKPRELDVDTEAAWTHLIEHGTDLWWDNREDKRSANAPDFKLKDASDDTVDFDRDALWLNSAPPWFDEDAFDREFYPA